MPGRYEGRKVFISYSRDGGEEAFARAVHKRFSIFEAQGLEVFLESAELHPTREWARDIGGAVDAADALVFMLSANSIASPNCMDDELRRFAARFAAPNEARRERGEKPVWPVFVFVVDDPPPGWNTIPLLDAGDGEEGLGLGALQLAGPYPEGSSRPTYLKKIDEREHSEHYNRLIGDVLEFLAPEAQPVTTRRTRPTGRTKPVPGDPCIAFIDKEPAVVTVQQKLQGSDDRLVFTIASGGQADWHDALRLRLQYLDPQHTPSHEGVPAITWPSTESGLSRKECERNLWLPIAGALGRTGDAGPPDRDRDAAGFTEYQGALDDLAIGCGGLLAVHYRIAATVFSRDDRALLEDCCATWRALADGLERGRVAILLSLVEPAEPPPAPGLIDRHLRGVTLVDQALIESIRAGMLKLGRFDPIRLDVLNRWDGHLERVFRLPADRRQRLLQLASAHLEACPCPHDTLRLNLKKDPEFTAAIGAGGT
jgi:hypothetical protein